MDPGVWRVLDVLISREKAYLQWAVLVKASRFSQELKANKQKIF